MKRRLERHLQATGGTVRFTVRGNSMGDTIRNGETVLVQFAPSSKITRGMVGYIRRGDKRIVHRILAVLGPICLEKGDANRSPRLCLRRNIVGFVQSETNTPAANGPS